MKPNKISPTTIYWREVQKLRKVIGAPPVIETKNLFTFNNSTVFWYGSEARQAQSYLRDESEKNATNSKETKI